MKIRVELIKKLRLKPGCHYLIFISEDSGLRYDDLECIDLKRLGVKESMFVLLSGDPHKLVNVVEVI